MRESLSLPEARRLALSAQGFGRPRPTKVTAATLRTVMNRTRVTQIDSVNVFSRSHYMPYFSRVGAYDTALLDKLAFSMGSPFTEYWAHVATFMPIEDWNLFAFRMEENRQRYLDPSSSWMQAHGATLDRVRDMLASRGPSRPVDLETEQARGPRGPWWDWSAVKQSLERLFLAGDVAISHRDTFQRVYALTEHVIPSEVLSSPVPKDEAIRELALRAIRAHGVAAGNDLLDYFRLSAGSSAALRSLEDSGDIVRVDVDGWTSRTGGPLPAWTTPDAKIPRRIESTALLTPFDPVVWHRDRAARLFDFDYRIEIYTPEAKRQFGYYSLPILVDDELVGRVDLKADRKARQLLVQSAWWEHNQAHGAHAERVAEELRHAAAWQGLETISVGPRGTAADDIARALATAPAHAHRH